MNWLGDYKAKLRSPADAVGLIKSNDKVYYGGNAAIPQATRSRTSSSPTCS